MQLFETRSLSYSIALHAAAILIAAVGLPILLPETPEPVPLVMSVEILPIGDVTNVKPSDKAIAEEKNAPTPKTIKPVTPSATEKPVDQTPPDKPSKEPEKAEPLPGEKPKPTEKPKEESKPKADDFAALLNKLKQETKTEPAKEAKDTSTSEANKTKSDAPYDASQPLSISERDAIRNQFIKCWRMPAGAKDPHSLAARIKVKLREDGSLITATLAPDQQGRYGSDPFFRAAVDSAIRAVNQCSPIQNLPPDKYSSWGSMEFNFDPQEMLF